MRPPTIEDYDFHLPVEQIAQRPSEKRGGARLLHLPAGEDAPEDRMIADLPSFSGR